MKEALLKNPDISITYISKPNSHDYSEWPVGGFIMGHFRLDRMIKAPVEKVWAAADFTKSAGPFPMVIVNEGDPVLNDIGFERRATSGKITVLERLLEVDSPRSYTYTLVEGVPVKDDYLGKVELTPKGDSTYLTWMVTFSPKIPGTGWFAALMIKRTVRKIIDHIETICTA